MTTSINEIIAELRAQLPQAQTLADTDALCSIAMRKGRWLPKAKRPALAYEIGQIVGELIVGRFAAQLGIGSDPTWLVEALEAKQAEEVHDVDVRVWRDDDGDYRVTPFIMGREEGTRHCCSDLHEAIEVAHTIAAAMVPTASVTVAA